MTAPDETRERARDTELDAHVTELDARATEADLPDTEADARDMEADAPGTAAAPAASGPARALELRKPGEVTPPGTKDVAPRAARDLDAPAPEGATAPERATTEPDGLAERDDGDGGGDDDGGGSGVPASHRRRRRPLRTAVLVAVAVAVVGGAGAAATGVFGGDGDGSDTAAPDAPPRTTKVQRTTLTRTETVNGSLGYGDTTAVAAPAAGRGSGGVVTWVPEDGDVLKRGDTVYRVAEREVPLLYGSIPFYRTLNTGSEGADVRILERNLAALGYTGFTVDDTYTSGTAAAVRDWQDDLGRDETGTVQPADAVVAPGARRVADVRAVPGAPLGGTVLSWTGTERAVTVDLDAQFEDLVRKGTKATVTLPDDTTVRAEVTDVGTPTTARDGGGADGGGGSGGGSGDDKATLPVELKVPSQRGLGRYQAASVDVSLKAETREDVLVVPVNALVAQRGGGYAVDVVESGGDVRRVPVKPGLFADSMVEVSGKGLTAGTVVGVPK
ncbi:Putative peptidoglycan binding domain protein [Streptomyces sp. YIM 121038]|uniref:peptidoglycan-binding protein n=1 Tax=Streptomyces sp. YIM 121038 TaxID=2136401 RepID=UPI001162676C|nr:peptidoglycan-binding protein [Streptomyces sp. YIM 121038]QCX74829.1 Putative peptidoglycan binding domain protein [Streptomyces sp. YIM 121038]